MPHQNGRIFVDSSTTPHRGIDIRGDIAAVLGRNTGDLGQLCGDVDGSGNNVGRINPWSKYKPVRYPQINTDSYPNWWKAQDGFCGLTPWSTTDINVMVSPNSAAEDPFDGNMNRWTYAPPRGLSQNEPFRVMDFNEYRHNAEPPVFGVDVSYITIPNTGKSYMVVSAIVNDSAENIHASDLGIGSLFFCVYMIRIEYPYIAFIGTSQGTTQTGSNDFSVYFPMDLLNITGPTPVTIVPMLSSQAISEPMPFNTYINSQPPTTNFYTIPMTNRMGYLIPGPVQNPYLKITWAKYEPSNGAFNFKPTVVFYCGVINAEDGATVTNVLAKIKRPTSSDSDTLLPDEMEASLTGWETDYQGQGAFLIQQHVTFEGDNLDVANMIESQGGCNIYLHARYTAGGTSQTLYTSFFVNL